MQRILRGTAAQVSVTLTDVSGAPADATGAVAVSVERDSDGTVVASGNATHGATGVYTFALTPAQVAEVDLLNVTWTATIASVANQAFLTQAEIVGARLCSLAAITDAGATGDTTAARDWAETTLEDACGKAFRPRYAKDTIVPQSASWATAQVFSGIDFTNLLLIHKDPIKILAVTVDGTALTQTEIDAITIAKSGLLTRTPGWGGDPCTIAYTYGFSSVPEPVSRAAVRLARAYLTPNPSDYDERSTRVDTPEASYSLVTPGVRGAITSLPEVNAVIQMYGASGVGVA